MGKFPDAEVADTTEPAQSGGIPPGLLCEQCGQDYVAVVVSWMHDGACDRLCNACYLATAAAALQEIINANPD